MFPYEVIVLTTAINSWQPVLYLLYVPPDCVHILTIAIALVNGRSGPDVAMSAFSQSKSHKAKTVRIEF